MPFYLTLVLQYLDKQREKYISKFYIFFSLCIVSLKNVSSLISMLFLFLILKQENYYLWRVSPYTRGQDMMPLYLKPEVFFSAAH